MQLFQEFRIIGSKKLQLLGDLFENLLTKGFKQNEGQFFTPIPVAKFIWNSIPDSEIITENKELLSDYSRPSILWGIDGDWMVNIIEANKKFYPTDHCGYIRILCDDIMPEYLALALEVEGRLENFSRANRASTDRIRKITIHVPEDIKEQERIINEIKSVKGKKKKDMLIKQYFID